MKMDSRAAAEFNPYVAPIAADSYDTTDRGIGVWRDRWLLVMHKDASLPAICIKTGEPADRFLRFRLAWHYPIDWWTRKRDVDLPFCERGCREYRLRRLRDALILLTVSVTVSVAGGSLALFTDDIPRWIVFFLLIPLFVLLPAAAAVVVMRWRPIGFWRVRGPYLWLVGADPQFLAQLPPWTSGS
jgi:hypothetical protein